MRGSVCPGGYTTARSEAPRRSPKVWLPPDTLVINNKDNPSVAPARIATVEIDGYSGSSVGYSRYCVQSEIRHAGKKCIMLMHVIMPCDIRGAAVRGVNRSA
jgi:hypothetical protein